MQFTCFLMCIKTNVTDRKLLSWLHLAASLKQISKESFRAARCVINVPSMKLLYSLVNKTLCVMDAGKQGKHSWRRSLRSPLSCWYIPSARNGCGSSRSWMSAQFVQDGSLIFKPVGRWIPGHLLLLRIRCIISCCHKTAPLGATQSVKVND